MTKRSAEEALVVNGDGSGVCAQNKRKPSPLSGGNRAPPSHRVSCLSSSSSSNSIAPTSLASCVASSAAEKKPLCRTVTSLSSSTIDDDVLAQAGQKCGDDVNLDSTEGVRRVTRLINARILQRDGTLFPGLMDLSDGLIVGIHLGQSSSDDGEEELPGNVEEVVDCQGRIVSPGFIDIQLNGAYGVDFSNDKGLESKDILHVAKMLVETGVTSFCPTMVSSSRQTYRGILSLMRGARKRQQEQQLASGKDRSDGVGANILGMHLEGPFFAPSKRGAHDEQHIVDPVNGMASVEEVYGIGKQQSEGEDEVSKLGDIDIITLAPELPGALEATRSLTANEPHSVVVSCGHTEATYEDGVKAVSHGATLLTHLYNAMNPFHHRKPGLVGLLSSEAKLSSMSLERPFFSMIVDGIHVHESAVSMAYRSHPHGCVLVTDAMTAMGLGDGEHSLGNMKVCIKGDRATLDGTDTLAGSVVSMDTCVKRFHKFTGCTIGEALLCATLHPAMVLKRHVVQQRKGSVGRFGVVDAPVGTLEVGSRADLVVLNEDLDVLGTWVAGQLAFQKK